MVRELQDKQRGADGDIPLDDGLECWRSLMTNIGREASVATAAKKTAATNDFDDLMLRAWIDTSSTRPS